MEKSIVISIKPEFATKILLGNKRCEFRKSKCKTSVKKVYFYATSPVKKVVGEAILANIITGNKEEIWENYKRFGGISKDYFDKYYMNNSEAIVYLLENPRGYTVPKDLKSLGINSVPQSFCYIKEE